MIATSDVLSATSWTGGLVAALLLDGTHQTTLTDLVVSASVPYGRHEPVVDIVVHRDRLIAVTEEESLPAEVRLRAAITLDLLTAGDMPVSVTDVAGGDWSHTTIERFLRVLWAYLVGDAIAPPPAWPVR